MHDLAFINLLFLLSRFDQRFIGTLFMFRYMALSIIVCLSFSSNNVRYCLYMPSYFILLFFLFRNVFVFSYSVHSFKQKIWFPKEIRK